MGLARVPGDHVAADAVRKAGQLAQVLEGLGVALANHIGAVVAVEHPDQLPGVLDGFGQFFVGRRAVVLHQVADLPGVAQELGAVGVAGVFADDGLGVGGGGLGALDQGGVHGVEVGIVRSIGLQHGEGEYDLRSFEVDIVPHVGIVAVDGGLGGRYGIDVPVQPVQLIGAVQPQGGGDQVGGVGQQVAVGRAQRRLRFIGDRAARRRVEDQAQPLGGDPVLAQQLRGGCFKLRGGALAGGHLQYFRLECVVEGPVDAGQLAARVDGGLQLQAAGGTGVEEPVDVAREQGVAVRGGVQQHGLDPGVDLLRYRLDGGGHFRFVQVGEQFRQLQAGFLFRGSRGNVPVVRACPDAFRAFAPERYGVLLAGRRVVFGVGLHGAVLVNRGIALIGEGALAEPKAQAEVEVVAEALGGGFALLLDDDRLVVRGPGHRY